MTKKSHQKFWWIENTFSEKVKLETFATESENVSELRGNLKKGEGSIASEGMTPMLKSILRILRSCEKSRVNLFIHSTISVSPLKVHYYSEALPTSARILYRSFTPKRTGNCR